MAGTPVRLNVYDMYWLNDYAASIGFGVYHSGVEVCGVEYAYGGHPCSLSGIFENTPQDVEELGENFRFRESIELGETHYTPSGVRQLIETLGRDFRGDQYHLISKNCNHFTSALAKELTGQDIPSWINRLAFLSGSIPFLERCLPQEWLTPVALQNTIDERKTSGEILNGSIESTEESSLFSLAVRARNGFKSVASEESSNAPTSTRTSSPVHPFNRIWNSIKSFTSQTE